MSYGTLPHLSRSEVKLRQPVDMQTPAGVPVIYRGSAYLQFKTAWDDNTHRFEPMTDEQKKTCDDFAEQLRDHGIQISVSLQAKIGDEPRSWPKVLTMTLLPNKPRDDAQQAPMDQQQAPAPSAPPQTSKEIIDDDIGF